VTGLVGPTHWSQRFVVDPDVAYYPWDFQLSQTFSCIRSFFVLDLLVKLRSLEPQLSLS